MSTNSSTSTPHALDHLEGSRRDAEGRLIIGNPTLGCPFCSEVSTKIGKHNDGVIHHPAVECCVERLTQEINWRSDELKQSRNSMAAEEAAVADMRDRVEEMDTRAKQQSSQKKAERAEKNLERRKRDHYHPQITELAAEIARLKRKRDTKR